MSASPNRTRVVKSREERRREILDAAMRLFRDEGFEETTVQDIARGAGVASGTVYLYFSSKEEILTELENAFFGGMQERIGDILADVARRRTAGEVVAYYETSNRIIETLVAHALEHREVCHVLSKYAPRGDVVTDPDRPRRMLEIGMAEAFRAGTARAVIHTSDPEMAAYLLNSVACMAVQEAAALGDPDRVRRVVESLKELFRKALAPIEESVDLPP